MAKRKTTARRLAVEMARVCAENRASDVVVLDLRKRSPVAEFFVVATGTSARQMRAVADHVREAGVALGERPFGSEGYETGWVLVDYVGVVVHLFGEDARSYYDLELLWGDAPRVDWRRGWKPRDDAAPPSPRGGA